MEFVELSEKEFKQYASKHPQANFYQTIEWGKLKKTNAWNMHLLGLKDGKKIVAGGLLLSKKLFGNRKMFYSPRGFLLDYNNYEVLSNFTKGLKKYVKKEKGIFIKIDPNVMYQQRDLYGQIVPNGENNYEGYENLKKLGYRHLGFNLMQEELQPRWIFVTRTKDTTVDEVMKNMDSKTRQILRKNERNLVKCREIGYDELPVFKDIMQHTGDRREFIDRPLSYYQNMYEHLHESGILKILLAEINTVELVEKLENDIKDLQKEYDDRKEKYENNVIKMNEQKYEQKQKENLNNVERTKERIVHIKGLAEKHGEILTLGGILFLIYGGEVLSLVGGSYKELMEFQSAYNLHFEMLKYAVENNYDRYNFYGITGDFREENPLYGLYSFKRDFGGEVVELMGEFDLVVSKFYYFAYNLAFKIYRGLKHFLTKLRK